ncbi:MAG: ParB N-terminal domain-containing protein [Dehalococcoidia bacterium]
MRLILNSCDFISIVYNFISKDHLGNTVLALSVNSRELERCEKAIREYGLTSPVVVRSVDGAYQVLSGECERMVLARMRQSVTSAVVVEQINDPEATRLSLLLSALKRTPTALSEGLLLRDLCQEYRQSQTEAAYLVGRSVSWVNKRLALAERLAKSVVELVKAGQISPHTAQEIARLPQDVQQIFANHVVAERLAKSVVEKLVVAYNDPGVPESVRQQVLEHPREALPLVAHARKSRGRRTKDDANPGALAGRRMHCVLLMLFRLAGEAEGLLSTLSPVDRHNLKQMLKSCTEALWRFTRLARACFEDTDFSPRKSREEAL